MHRQFFVRLLLSLVLLLSQQMATLHALDHLTEAMDPRSTVQVASNDGSDHAAELAKAVAQHQNCHQCLAFAQLVAPMASMARSFVAPELVRHHAARPTLDLHRVATIWSHQARAPPLV